MVNFLNHVHMGLNLSQHIFSAYYQRTEPLLCQGKETTFVLTRIRTSFLLPKPRCHRGAEPLWCCRESNLFQKPGIRVVSLCLRKESKLRGSPNPPTPPPLFFPLHVKQFKILTLSQVLNTVIIWFTSKYASFVVQMNQNVQLNKTPKQHTAF